jgi:hypothetical protein
MVVALATFSGPAGAGAIPNSNALKSAAPELTTNVRHRGSAAAGFALGFLGGAIVGSQGYYYGPGYYYPPPYYYYPAYPYYGPYYPVYPRYYRRHRRH